MDYDIKLVSSVLDGSVPKLLTIQKTISPNLTRSTISPFISLVRTFSHDSHIEPLQFCSYVNPTRDVQFLFLGGGWRVQASAQKCVVTSELNFHLWNANWPMKSEAKMAAHGGQFCTSVSVPYAGLYVSFNLPLDFLNFLKIFLIENTHKTCLWKIEMSLRISNILRKSQTELQVTYFHENKLLNRRETW